MKLSEKLIAAISKAKSVDEMLEAYHALGEHLHKIVEDHRKELIDKANQLPKLNNAHGDE